ncbi:sialate O-acetylesterase [Planctomycetota bacterium]|nr:sialate O-acetylesterase [Planctomycetota bacterium]
MILRSLVAAALAALLSTLASGASDPPSADTGREPVRVFIFAGQSNMVGSDSKVSDIERFPPFDGLGEPQEKVRFQYCIGREQKMRSDGWVDLQPVNGVVGPELSFAREVTGAIDAPIAIIKCAAGGTHLGGDWNPDEPSGFEMYPLTMDLVRSALAELDRKKVPYRLEGVMWHQGENDMFNEDYQKRYGENLANFVARWRKDLDAPDLRFYVGELCTKTIWGMDLRPRMHAISVGQRAVTEADPLSEYVPTSHVGVEIGGGVGLHYHYGTLGQLEHGVNYARAYLRNIGALEDEDRGLKKLPFRGGRTVKLFVLAGHRNMEGERAFVQELRDVKGGKKLLKDQGDIAYRYSVGGDFKTSSGWELLGPCGPYDTFGPELSFGAALVEGKVKNVAIAKFTHSGSQIVDWTPDGSVAVTRNLYPRFIEFVKASIKELRSKGYRVDLEGVFYHVGENDMSFGPFRRGAAGHIGQLIEASRKDLKESKLHWYVSQQPPTDHKDVNGIDVMSEVAALAAADRYTFHVPTEGLPPQEKQLVISTEGIVALGAWLAEAYLAKQ